MVQELPNTIKDLNMANMNIYLKMEKQLNLTTLYLNTYSY